MRRGTTPTITATVNQDISDMSIHLAFKVGSKTVVKKGDDLEVEAFEQDGETYTRVKAKLTQEDTLAFRAGKECEVQIRAVTGGGLTAIATSIDTIPVGAILEEGVIDG